MIIQAPSMTELKLTEYLVAIIFLVALILLVLFLNRPQKSTR